MALALFLLTSTALAEAVPVNATEASISCLSRTLAPGDSFNLSVVKYFPVNMDEPLVWESTNTAVATVSETDGLKTTTVAALKNGRATIRLKGSRSLKILASCQVTVRTVKITSMAVSPKTLTIAPGKNYTLSISIKPASATYRTVTWTSPDPTIVSFDGAGVVATAQGTSVKVYAHAVGKAALLAVTDTGRKAYCVVTVKDLAVTSVKFPKSKYTVYLEDPKAQTLTAVVSPSTAADTTVTYSSSQPAVADIDPNTGVLTLKATGNTVITASAGGKTGTCKLTVASKAIKSLSISTPDGAAVVLDPAGTAQLTAVASPSYASNRNVSWSSDNTAIATVDLNTGLVTGVSGGIAKITVTSAYNAKVKSTVTVHVRGDGAYKTITVTSAGDAVLGGDPRSHVVNAHSYQDFKNAILLPGDDSVAGDGSVFTRVAKYFQGDDNVSTLNLECALTYKLSRDKYKSFVFQGDPGNAKTMLKASGIDAVNIANNHSYDVGKDGYEGTMRALTKGGVKYYGNGNTCYVTTASGVKVAFLGFISKDLLTGSMRKQIQNAAKRSDMVVVMYHWTDVPEFRYAKPNSRQQSIAHAAISAGADLVLGEHTHRLNGIERYKGKYIVYDMGNFVTIAKNPLNAFGPSNPYGKYDYDSMIYQQKFHIWTDGFVEPSDITIIPCSITSSPKATVNNAQPMPYTDSTDIDRVEAAIKAGSPSNFSEYPITFTH